MTQLLPGLHRGEQHGGSIATAASGCQDSTVAKPAGAAPGFTQGEQRLKPAVLRDVAGEHGAGRDRRGEGILAHDIESLAAPIDEDLVVYLFQELIDALFLPGLPDHLRPVEDVSQAQDDSGLLQLLVRHLQAEAKLTLHAERRMVDEENVRPHPEERRTDDS